MEATSPSSSDREINAQEASRLLPALHEASNPYWDWLWGSASEALARLTEWFSRPTSELSGQRFGCLREQNQLLGGYIALPGKELQDCRKADLIALMSYLRQSPACGVADRLRQARSLFHSVGEQEFYLSRIVVLPAARGQGLGRRLLKTYLAEGQRRGFSRFRLDVSTENEGAIALYRGEGFTVDSESVLPGSDIRYCSMVASYEQT